MALLTDPSNLDPLITPLQLHYGDVAGTAYSEAVYRTALVNAVRYLHTRWKGKYILDGIDIARNPDVLFVEDSPPIIETAGDEWALVLAATIIIRGMALTSSTDAFTNWSTPDLSVSSGSKERALTKLYDASIQELNDHFGKNLGTSRKRFMYNAGTLTYPVLPISNSE